MFFLLLLQSVAKEIRMITTCHGQHDARNLGEVSRAILLLGIILISSSALFAQGETATVSGVITEQSGGAVVGAEVRVTNADTNVTSTTTSNQSGIYLVTGLRPGRYRIKVEKQGFKGIDLTDLVLNVQDSVSRNFTLQIGSMSESITVEANTLTINTADGSVSTVVDQTYVANMPLNGRSFQDLILLTPGVVTNSPQSPGLLGARGEFSVNGQRTESNYYTVDGVSANTGIQPGSYLGSSGSVAAATALGTTQALVSVDALQEFRVQSSTYAAEYGRNPGGQFSFETRSGTNQWHGTAFDYLRNDYFDANNWFNNFFGVREPPLRQNDFGGSLGGPVHIPGLYNGKDRTFFFFSYEGLRLRQPQAATINYVPDSALRQSAPPPLQAVLNAFPAPNGPEALNSLGNPIGLAEFIGAWSNPGSLDAYSVRLDHSFNDKLRVFFRFSDTPSKAQTRLTDATRGTPSVFQALAGTSRTYTFGGTSALSSRVSNQFRLNYSSIDSSLSSSIDGFGGAQPVNLAQLQQVSPGNSYTVQVLLSFAPHFIQVNERSTLGLQRQWNLTDSVSVSLGRHQLKSGVDFRRLTPVQQVGSPNALYQFRTQSQVQSNSPSQAVSANNANFYPVYTNFSAFVQDEWKVTHRLNLSMGLRWEVNPATDVTQGPLPLTVQGANNFSTMTLAPPGTRPWQTAWYNFAPRLGAAYVLRNASGHETVVRGGGGLFFDTGEQSGSFAFGSPNYRSQALFGTAFGHPASFPLSPAQALPPIQQSFTPRYAQLYVYPPHLQLPYTIQWNLTVEQALGRSQALSLGYVGSHAGRLLQENLVNVAPFNPNFSRVEFLQSGSKADYNALQIQFRRRISHGLTALASYTFGHSIDYGSTSFTLPYTRGNSDFDVRHNFTSAFSYDLPNTLQGRVASAVFHHWGLDDRFTARTAFPVTLDGSTNFDPITREQFNLGLNIVPNQPFYLYGSQYPGGREINPNAFCDRSAGPCAGGQAPRNFARGFGAWQMDVAVRREFPIYERVKLQFRAEVFNVFNHPNFGTVDQNYCSLDPNSPSFSSPCTFGQATGTLNTSLGTLSPLYQAGGPRSMQFALKVIF